MSPRRNSIEAQLVEVSGAVLTPVRWVVLFGILVSLHLKFGLQPPNKPAVLIASALYAAVAAGLPRLRGRPFTSYAISRLLLAADLLFSAAIFQFTDGIRSPYFGIWYLALIHAALVLDVWDSMAIAIGAAAFAVAHEWMFSAASVAHLDVNMTIGKLPFLLLITWSPARLAQELRRREAARREVERRAMTLEAAEERRRQELETARRVQVSLLPLTLPERRGVAVASFSQPAREVGGDTFDVIDLPDGRLLVVVADVSGKGMPAALLAAAVQQAVRQFAGPDPAAVLAGVNRMLLENSLDQMFVTALCVVLDPRDGRATAANAGHPPLLWWNERERRLVPMRDHGPILGIVSEWSAPTREWLLGPGDALMLYTDGVEDAKTGPEERLGEEALIERLGRSAPESAAEWIERVRHTLNACVEWPDDVTAVVLQREPQATPTTSAGRLPLAGSGVRPG
jgi:serine phosphatase RsbU (regulator of sigma subunit)